MYLIKFICNLFCSLVFFITSVNAVLAANYTVTSTSDSGFESLREAIIAANDTVGSDTIAFEPAVFLPTSPATITLTSPLPALTDNAGTTMDGNGGVIITGSTDTFVGMTIRSSNNIIRGLQLNGLRLGIEFDRLTVNSDNIIGGTMPGQRNVISNNWVAGISLSGANTFNNTVVGNYIGLNSYGTAALGSQDVGVDIVRGAHDNIIGGSTPGERNIISGNTFVGIRISDTEEDGTTNNHIQGNYIGTDYSGMLAIPNNRGGIGIGQNATGNFIGGTVPGSGNVISGNTGLTPHGIRFSQANGNYIYGNIIGLTADALAPLPNGYGIRLESEANNNIIGGPSENMRNIISGNNNSGISIAGTGGNIIQGNFIGTDASGTAALKNTIYGIYIGGNSINNLVGGIEPGSGNIISGGHVRGISISGTTASNNRVLGNFIGTDISGTVALGNEDGIRISDAPNNIIGGTETGESNVISGNNVFGIVISNSSATGNQILGNKIGTDLSGTVALGNGTTGIFVGSSASGNIIGGTTTGAGNLISSNSHRGIQVSDGASNNQILGNFIGTDVTGTVDLGNGGDGIMIHSAPDNIIGGTASGARNLISGNDDDGVSVLAASATGNQIIGNYIGTDLNGVNAIGNFRGVQIADAPGNTIFSNLIHHNTIEGVLIQTSGAVNDTLTQNSITANGDGLSEKGIIVRDGANYNIAAPIITDVTISQVTGTSTAPDGSIIEIFQDPGDQGEVYIGSTSVSGGAFTFNGTPPPGATGGYLTVTVTDPAGNTSEFSLPVLNNLSTSTASVWRTETVDSAGDVGYCISIDLDSSGYPHISYMDLADWDLMHAYHDGSGWYSYFVDKTFWVGDTSLKMDSSNRIHLSYFDYSGGLNYAYSDDGMSWYTDETIDSEGLAGFGTSIALNSSDYPHISYFNDTAKSLKYAYFDGTEWHTETVDTSVYDTVSSIDLDSSEKPHICYYDYYSQEIRYAHKDGGIWDIQTVASAAHYAHPSMALDSAGKPHIAYYDPASRSLNHASPNGMSWSIETVDAHAGPGYRPSIAVDFSDNLHISYIGDGNLKYVYHNGSGWHIETVDSSGLCGYHTSLTLDASDNPHIAYLDLTNKSLKYASRYGIAISDTETIASPGGDIEISISEGTFSIPPEIGDVGAGIPDGFITPYGAISFTISTDPGETVTVILTFPEELSIGTTLFKCINGDCSPITGATISGNQVVFDVTDGGSLDEDFTVNGEIVEPSVLAVPAQPEVAVDIKPGSCPNPVNVNSSGVLPVAILCTHDLDVTTIDPGTIRLAGISPLRWALEDVATPYEPFIGKQTANDCTDAGPDGLTDLTLKFNTQELVQSLEVLLGRELEDGEAVVVRLSGNLREAHGSAAFLGEDVVVVLKK